FWLFGILVVRYAQFFTGLAVLAFLGKAPELRATMAGKVVAVVQSAGIVILLARKLFPGILSQDTVNACLFPILGVAFSCMIVSQTVIGWKALRGNL
ncbi:MAG: hypothetical protein KAX38_04580, partial [Candidatus Krumholzibacteria bacterium]|nr:hypothetical protein [Candidatus Krumholzibacteria bacterium]